MKEFSADMIQKQVMAKLYLLGIASAKEMETYAKANAPWTDRTTNARNGLYGKAITRDGHVVVMIGHSMEYGYWLENSNRFKYAILFPTLLKHYDQIMGAVERIFR